MLDIKNLISKAKEKYPVSINYEGRLFEESEEDLMMLEKECDVHCISVYMNGTGVYSIRYKHV